MRFTGTGAGTHGRTVHRRKDRGHAQRSCAVPAPIGILNREAPVSRVPKRHKIRDRRVVRQTWLSMERMRPCRHTEKILPPWSASRPLLKKRPGRRRSPSMALGSLGTPGIRCGFTCRDGWLGCAGSIAAPFIAAAWRCGTIPTSPRCKAIRPWNDAYCSAKAALPPISTLYRSVMPDLRAFSQ